MRTVRNGTFETNSSSCHSVTIMKKNDWEDFKAGKYYIRDYMFGDIEEHASIFNDASGHERDDYFRDINKLYAQVDEAIKSRKNYSSGRFHGYGHAELDDAIWNFLKKDFNRDVFNKIVFGKGTDIVCKLKKPIVINYGYYNGAEHSYTYEELTVSDFYDFLFGNDHFDGDIDSFVVYEGDWLDAKVDEYQKVGGTEDDGIVIITREIEC